MPTKVKYILSSILFCLSVSVHSTTTVIAVSNSKKDSSTTEWIQVYFNMPPDTSIALEGNVAGGSADLIGSLVNLIDSARHSVDLCVYDLEHKRVGRALVRAKKRGVRVRLITDNYNRMDNREVDEPMWRLLGEAGLVSLDDDGDLYGEGGMIEDNSLTNAGADMHHKFCVVDALSEDPDDDYIWTGSTNMTYTGAYNTNHTLVIKDNEVAAAYLHEFEQMWGGSGDTPNWEKARFHKDKEAYSEHIFHVGQTKVELYFSPINRTGTKPSISKRLVEVMKKEAGHDIHFQAFAITPDIPISQTMWRLSAKGDIELRGIIDRSYYYRYKKRDAIWASPFSRVNNRTILPSNELRKLHQKVMIFDGKHPDPADCGIVVTGSYNFSRNAEYYNDENLLIIYSDEITNQYMQDWQGAMNRAQNRSWPPYPPFKTDSVYTVEEVTDGNRFLIELVPGFDYEIQLLGVEAPYFTTESDSVELGGWRSERFLTRLLEDRRIRLTGAGNNKPIHRYGRLYGYAVTADSGEPVSVNTEVLREGYGRFSDAYSQHPDSVRRFKQYEQSARNAERGLWDMDSMMGKTIALPDSLNPSSSPDGPININSAEAELLQTLSGIGPSYAQRIITYREKHGGFRTIDEIQQVKGIGPKTFEKIRPRITIE